MAILIEAKNQEFLEAHLIAYDFLKCFVKAEILVHFYSITKRHLSSLKKTSHVTLKRSKT